MSRNGIGIIEGDYDFIPAGQSTAGRKAVAVQHEMWLDGTAKKETCSCGCPVALFDAFRPNEKVPVIDGIVRCPVCGASHAYHSEYQGVFVERNL